MIRGTVGRRAGRAFAEDDHAKDLILGDIHKGTSADID